MAASAKVGYFKVRGIRRNPRKGNMPHAISYRFGLEKGIVNEQTGKLHRQARDDVRATGILLPSKLKPQRTDSPKVQAEKRQAMEWALDPVKLAQAIERSELAAKAIVGREYMAVLPRRFQHDKSIKPGKAHEVLHRKRLKLTLAVGQRIADRYGVVVTYAIHAPKKGRAVHHHAHLVASSRKITLDGFTEKSKAEQHPQREARKVRYEIWHEQWHASGAISEKPIRRYKSRATGVEVGPVPWKKSREVMEGLGHDVAKTDRQFQRGTRLTPKQRAAQQERVAELREKREAAVELKRLRTNELARKRYHEAKEGKTPEGRTPARATQRQSVTGSADSRRVVARSLRDYRVKKTLVQRAEGSRAAPERARLGRFKVHDHGR